jgi:hypothetical protein
MEIVGYLSASVETFVKLLLTQKLLTKALPINGHIRVYLLLWESVFGEPLASNGLPPWRHYSGFQASCHRINIWL